MSSAAAHQNQSSPGFAPARDLVQRRRDTESLLTSETTAWVATAGPRGAHMIPLLFLWDGAMLTLATDGSSATVTNLRHHRNVRMAIGHPYDLAMIDAATELIPAAEIGQAAGDLFASMLRGGPDPRATPGYVYIQATPVRIQAWRHVAELHGRTLMRHGTWLTPR
jgi:nitroimidazol reductase NimA-like FMN-containing flavoprotein (pyridoxamine 5'-phosphate oxidase superfamily)